MMSMHAGNQTAKELQAFAVATFTDIVKLHRLNTAGCTFTMSYSQTRLCMQASSQRAAGLCGRHLHRRC